MYIRLTCYFLQSEHCDALIKTLTSCDYLPHLKDDYLSYIKRLDSALTRGIRRFSAYCPENGLAPGAWCIWCITNRNSQTEILCIVLWLKAPINHPQTKPTIVSYASCTLSVANKSYHIAIYIYIYIYIDIKICVIKLWYSPISLD